MSKKLSKREKRLLWLLISLAVLAGLVFLINCIATGTDTRIWSYSVVFAILGLGVFAVPLFDVDEVNDANGVENTKAKERNADRSWAVKALVFVAAFWAALASVVTIAGG